MTTYITYRGIEYRVSGHLSPRYSDRAGDGIIIARVDGRPIRGAKMYPGMVQIGISDTLTRLAEAAIVAACDAA